MITEIPQRISCGITIKSEIPVDQGRAPRGDAASQPHVAAPGAGLVRDGAGNLYGTTESGGVSNSGTVYKVDKVHGQDWEGVDTGEFK